MHSRPRSIGPVFHLWLLVMAAGGLAATFAGRDWELNAALAGVALAGTLVIAHRIVDASRYGY